MDNTRQLVDIACSHCGDKCDSESLVFNEKTFCCQGCLLIYQVLDKHGMEAYYLLNPTPGISQQKQQQEIYEFLDDEKIINSLSSFREAGRIRVKLNLPQIHCSSCLWLLENLFIFNEGVVSSVVNFSKKEAHIIIEEEKISLRSLVELLVKIGYKPELNYASLNSSGTTKKNNTLLYQLGVAGFCFGNIMLLSFPEYLGLERDAALVFINYLSLVLSLPVLLYSGKDYLVSAYNSLKFKAINIDVPIALGMLALFLRSVYDVISFSGTGFFDSFTGFVFFLLIGKWFQSFTYDSLDFERDYSSFFPLSVERISQDDVKVVPINELKKGDIIRVRNEQIIPADSILLSDSTKIDYSFVTGEADPIKKNKGAQILAGGKQIGQSILLKIAKKVDNSYLTQLWNEDVFKSRPKDSYSNLLKEVSVYFIFIILIVAFFTLIYWLIVDPSLALNAFTAVLIIACPCVLALSIPFTYGNIIRILSKKEFYLQNLNVIENIQKIDVIVFDKTGTITETNDFQTSFKGVPLTESYKELIRTACSQSQHPLSVLLAHRFNQSKNLLVQHFEEHTGLGHTTFINKDIVKIGSSEFVLGLTQKSKNAEIHLKINKEYVGKFIVKQKLRKGLNETLKKLAQHYELFILSGDNSTDKSRMETLLPHKDNIVFNCSPIEKLKFISKLQSEGKRVMMVGDGLNDAGALKQSDVGVVVAHENLNFTPSSNGIVKAEFLKYLAAIFFKIRKAKGIIYGAIFMSIIYNVIGLYYAVTAQLSPVVAAILMPISSISIIIYGVLASSFLFYRIGVK